MKQAPGLDTVQARMRPGVITLEGFLGTDTRRLGDILTDDDAVVRRLGVTHAAIAGRMRVLREAGGRGLGNFTRVEGRYDVCVDDVRGKIPCPWEDGIYQKTNTVVRDPATGEEMTFTDLNVHMIEAHGFYEGRGSQFRLEPDQLVRRLAVPRVAEEPPPLPVVR